MLSLISFSLSVIGVAMSLIKATPARQACVQDFRLRKGFLGKTLLITFCVFSPPRQAKKSPQALLTVCMSTLTSAYPRQGLHNSHVRDKTSGF